MNPEYMLYCEACGHKVYQQIKFDGNYVMLHCENKHVNQYNVVELVQCFTEHCEDSSDAAVPSNPPIANS